MNWLPTTIAVGTLGLNALLDLVFYRLGIWGIPLATSIVNVVGTVALLVLMRRRLVSLNVGRPARAAVRIMAASAVAAGVAFAVWWALDEALGRTIAAQVGSLVAALVAAGLAYVGACRTFGVSELQALVRLRRREA